MQKVCNMVFHILPEHCVQIFKNHENKATGLSVVIVTMLLTCPISKEMFPLESAPKVLLDPSKDIFITELYKQRKLGRKINKK